MPIKMIILGHRGEGCTNRDHKVYGKPLPPRNDPFFQNKILPENALSAFESALLHGADGIECDVFPSKDGVAMVIHDPELARNIDGYHFWGKEQNQDCLGNITDYTAAELRAKFTIGNNEPIPTLDELIQLLIKHNAAYREQHGRNLTINIELKAGEAGAIVAYEVVKKYLEDVSCSFNAEDFLFNSFEVACLEKMKDLDPRMRCALGYSTKELYECTLKMPGWVPEAKDYSPKSLINLEAHVKEMKLSGLDVVTSDVKYSLADLCDRKHLFLNAATNALRLRVEAETCHSPEAEWTELQREEKEIRKLAKISTTHNLMIYYKADNPGLMKGYLRKLEAIDETANREKERTKAYLEKQRSNYDPRLLASLRESMREFQQVTQNEMGEALAQAYTDAISEELSANPPSSSF
jgi:glycerophosphoryl diester phosphodiesterase